jgi:ribose 1,5-bisphosphokinase PhnN
MTHRPRYLIVIGPSGAGKSSVLRELDRRQMVVVQPTWTTRPRRPEELDGSPEHRFVSDLEFDDLLRAGSFSHTGAIAGLPYRYGLPAFEPGDGGPVEAVILRAPYVDPLTRHVPGAIVYQIQSRGDQMARRIQARNGGVQDLGRRVADNITETSAGHRVADRTFANHGTLGDLVDSVAGAMTIDFSRRSGSALGRVAS